jgi:hypothetical protein
MTATTIASRAIWMANDIARGRAHRRWRRYTVRRRGKLRDATSVDAWVSGNSETHTVRRRFPAPPLDPTLHGISLRTADRRRDQRASRSMCDRRSISCPTPTRYSYSADSEITGTPTVPTSDGRARHRTWWCPFRKGQVTYGTGTSAPSRPLGSTCTLCPASANDEGRRARTASTRDRVQLADGHRCHVPSARSRARFILERCFDGDLVMVASLDHVSPPRWVFEYAYQTAGYARAH